MNEDHPWHSRTAAFSCGLELIRALPGEPDARAAIVGRARKCMRKVVNCGDQARLNKKLVKKMTECAYDLGTCTTLGAVVARRTFTTGMPQMAIYDHVNGRHNYLYATEVKIGHQVFDVVEKWRLVDALRAARHRTDQMLPEDVMRAFKLLYLTDVAIAYSYIVETVISGGL